MTSYLLIVVSDYCDIMKVILTPEETEGFGNIRMEIIPFETELLGHNGFLSRLVESVYNLKIISIHLYLRI